MKWHNVEQRSPDWFALRLGIPTASCFHKILTPKTRKLSDQRVSYRNLLLAEWITGIPQEMDRYASRSMESGIENEDRARMAFEDWAGMELGSTAKPGFFTSDDGMIGASPDGLIGDVADLEIKCREIQTQVGLAISGVTDEHTLQIQGRLWLEEREYAMLFNYNSTLFLPPTKLGRDEKIIKDIAEAVPLFVNELLLCREKLEREYGPFIRKAPAEAEDYGDLGVTEADVDAILAAQREGKL